MDVLRYIFSTKIHTDAFSLPYIFLKENRVEKGTATRTEAPRRDSNVVAEQQNISLDFYEWFVCACAGVYTPMLIRFVLH